MNHSIRNLTAAFVCSLVYFSHATDAARIVGAVREPGEWLTHGRTYDEQRFSPLTAIDRANVHEVGLAWHFATGDTRGMEATPLVADGIMYVSTAWSRVVALDAVIGSLLWRFDPKVPGAKARDACCDVVNLDGRLIALHAKTGAERWSVQTTDPARPYTITGALAWRFYTVPTSADGPVEHEELRLAQRTWSPDSLWETGLGGTVWDSFAYDPELDLLYVGVGNGSQYNSAQRNPGGGDNLFLASILAVRPDTGPLVWHYQATPGESWDYTATQHMILADLEILGARRKVLMQAPKNRFFHVLDRATGELISAEPYVPVNWASHVDPESASPVETGRADWSEQTRWVMPAIVGGHNWHPMAFSPQTQLV